MNVIADTASRTGRRNFGLRAYLAGGTATSALIAGAAIVFLSLAAYVAFNGLGAGADTARKHDAVVIGSGGAPSAAAAAAAAAGRAAGAVAATPAARTAAVQGRGGSGAGGAGLRVRHRRLERRRHGERYDQRRHNRAARPMGRDRLRPGRPPAVRPGPAPPAPVAAAVGRRERSATPSTAFRTPLRASG